MGPREIFAGGRGLVRFWLLIAIVLAALAGALQWAGPPAPPAERPTGGHPPASPAPPPAKPAARAPPQEAAHPPSQLRPGRDTPGPIADPDPGLLEPVTTDSTDLLPRIAADGRMPMQVYAAGFDSSSRRPRVGLVLAGLGLNQSESEATIRALPRGITLAFSPYAQNPGRLLAAARSSEHEYLISLPMEPQSFPLNDPAGQALMTSLSPEQNYPRLLWMLSRIGGYVGATGVEAGMLGERFASLADEMNPVLAELGKRGLVYIDPRPRATPLPSVWSLSVDLIVDDPPTALAIDEKLAQLTQLARERGHALGLAGVVRPVTVQRIAAWANGLLADGLALAPVSALVRAPPR